MGYIDAGFLENTDIILPGFLDCLLTISRSLMESADVVVDRLVLRDFFRTTGSSSSLIVRSIKLRFLVLKEG